MSNVEKIKEYIVRVADQYDGAFASLKEARDYVRSLLNVHEVRGIKDPITILKKVTVTTPVDEIEPKTDNVGTIRDVFGNMEL